MIWPKEVTLLSRTQPSGLLCLWQCFWKHTWVLQLAWMVKDLQVVLFGASSSTQGTHKHQFERHKGGWSQVAWGGTFHAVRSWLSSKIGQHHLEGAAIGVKLLSHCLPGKPRYGRLNKSLGFYCPTEILHADGDHVLRGQLSSLLELNVILDVVRRNCSFCLLNLKGTQKK